MQEPTVTRERDARLTLHWVPVVDSRGRTRMEARWLAGSSASIRRTAAGHAA